jgi:hypothetical protein
MGGNLAATVAAGRHAEPGDLAVATHLAVGRPRPDLHIARQHDVPVSPLRQPGNRHRQTPTAPDALAASQLSALSCHLR